MKLRLKLIGKFDAHFGETRIDLRKFKAQAILVLLAMHSEFRCSRETIRGLLWTDSSESSAQISLRNAIWTLRTAFSEAGFDGFDADRRDVWLDPDQVETDIDQLLEIETPAQTLDQIRNAPTLPQALFDGMDGISDVFQERIDDYRAFAGRRIRQTLQQIHDAADDPVKKIDALRIMTAMAPLDEGLARDLIRAYRANGQTANALTVYQLLWNALDEAFGQEPSPETQDLIVKVKLRSVGADPLEAQRPRLMITPTETGHLSSGARGYIETLRETVCASLVRFREWRIIDAALLQGMGPDASNLQRADYGLTLSASEDEDQLNCRVLLADLQTGELLWSEHVTQPLTELTALPDDIVRRLAAALNIHLTDARLLHSPQPDPMTDAYGRWLQAQNLILQFNPESWRQAERELDELIKERPRFSRAYSSRASIENMRQISFPGIYSSPELHTRALSLASQAVQLDPMDSRGQLALGWSCAMSRQFDRAELAFELAFQYNENDPWTITSSAVGLAFCDHGAAAKKLIDLLLSLGMILEDTHWSYIAATCFLIGDYEGCIEASEKSHEISHDVPAWHAAALALSGRTQEAAVVGKRFQEIALQNWVAAEPSEPSELTRWVVSGFPIRNRDTWLAFRDGLRLAGLPVPDLLQSSQSALGYQLDLPQ